MHSLPRTQACITLQNMTRISCVAEDQADDVVQLEPERGASVSEALEADDTTEGFEASGDEPVDGSDEVDDEDVRAEGSEEELSDGGWSGEHEGSACGKRVQATTCRCCAQLGCISAVLHQEHI